MDITRRNIMMGGGAALAGTLAASTAAAQTMSGSVPTASSGPMAGKVVLLTGAGRGIGRASAVAFAQAGARLGLVDIADANGLPELGYPLASRQDLDETVQLVEAAGGEALALTADVRDRAAMAEAASQTAARFGGIDVVVANAGVGFSDDTFDNYDIDRWRTMWEVNVIGVANTVHGALVPLRRSGDPRVVILSSRAGRAGAAWIGYAVSKWGTTGFAKSLAINLGADNIRVNCVAPGFTDTPLPYHMQGLPYDDEGRAGITEIQNSTAVLQTGFLQPEMIAQVVLAAAGPATAYMSGATLDANGGTTARTAS